MKDKLLSMMGLCRRAGKVSMGNDAVIDSMRRGETRLALAAQDLSARTLRGLVSVAGETGTELLQITATMDEIAMAIGRRTGIVAVNDSGFAKKMKQLSSDCTLEPIQQKRNEEAENI